MIDFSEFLAEVSSLGPDGRPSPGASARKPYDWQTRFAQACLAGRPPQVVGVPTGAGKTTAVDALVWALATQIIQGGERTLGTRIVWAIDRRLIVDEVHEHASRLAARLDLALHDQKDPLHEVAEALAALSDGPPLVATRWRGGLDERVEFHSPIQPEVITSTVAQIGSRLLFRGYGVGKRSLPVAAGLAACDTTVCLDEAHLAEPFRQTVERIAAMQGDGHPLGLPQLRLIEVTATPRDADKDTILLSEEDKRQLGPRWHGEKSASLVTPESDKESDRVKVLVEQCQGLLEGETKTLACVVNSVSRARQVWKALKSKVGNDVNLGLLVGPQRQADRERFLNPATREVLFEGASPEKPIVVVATQTFEVGLDVDVEALVTESASSSALVQRLGRLNRRGILKGRAVIVRDAGSWLYGDDEKAAWEWLESRQDEDGDIDVSVRALHEDTSRPVPAPRSSAPLLTNAVVESLVQTAPLPHRWGSPDIESFIKGAESDPTADVEICWRSDLRLDKADGIEYSKMLVDLVRPARRELLTLNVLNARALLNSLLDRSRQGAARAALQDVDIEGEAAIKAAPDETIRNGASEARFLVVRHGEIHTGVAHAGKTAAISPGAIEPGDIVVLPTKLGGCDEHGLYPQAEEANDVAPDADPAAQESVVAIRLTAGALKTALRTDRVPTKAVRHACKTAWDALLEAPDSKARHSILKDLVQKLSEGMKEHAALAALAKHLDDEGLNLSLRLLDQVAPDGTQLEEEEESEGGDGTEEQLDPSFEDAAEDKDVDEDEDLLGPDWVLLVGKANATDELERSALPNPSPPTLTEHSSAVRRELETYMERLDLAPQVKKSLLFAATTHDLGKADPRFQDFLHGGRAPLGAVPIAKSFFGTRDPRTSRVAAAVSGLPRGFRHEIESVAIVADATAQDGVTNSDIDRDLVLACVGGHHGLGLPVPDVAIPRNREPQPFGAEVDGVRGTASGDGSAAWDHGEWLERFWRVVNRYGPWQFAYLLGLLVLADRTVSSRGQ